MAAPATAKAQGRGVSESAGGSAGSTMVSSFDPTSASSEMADARLARSVVS